MGTPEFNLTNEIEKLRQMLWLPITHIEFDARYEYAKLDIDEQMHPIWTDPKVFINDDMIGTIPYLRLASGYGYSNDHCVFAWDKIYSQYSQVIFEKILQREPMAIDAAPAEYKHGWPLLLNVKDKNGAVIKKACCRFVDDEWEVSVMSLDVKSTRKTVKVTLVPPTTNL